MQFNSTSRNAVALTALLVLAAFAAPFVAAAPTVDTTTSPSTETSEVTDGTTYDKYNASGSIGWLNASYDSDNPGLDIIDPASGEVIMSIGSGSSRWNEYDAANNSYGINLTEGDFATVPMDANEQKNVTLRMDGNTSNSSSALYTNITITLNNTGERAVVHAGSEATKNGLAEVEEETTRGLSFWSESTENITTLEADSVGIAGDNTTVFVVYSDDTVAEPYETAAEDKVTWFGLSSSDYEDGDQIQDHVFTAEGMYYAIYSADAPDSVTENEDATYAEWETLNGDPVHKIELGEKDFDGESTVDVMTKGNAEADLNFGEEIHTFEEGGFLGFSLQTSPGVYGQAGA